jgi:hypothetical protein
MNECVQEAGRDPAREVADEGLHAAVGVHDPEIAGLPGFAGWRRLWGGCAVVSERTSRWQPG